MGFSEILQELQNPGEDGVRAGIYDDLSAEYTAVVEGGAASVAERDATIAEMGEEIGRLKALNFDLLMAAGSDDEPDTPEDNPNDDPDDSVSIDDLFEEEGSN